MPGTVVVILLSDGVQTCGKLLAPSPDDKKYEGMGESGYKALSELVKTQEDVHQWKFFFLGANMDVRELGPKLGFNTSTCKSQAMCQNKCWLIVPHLNTPINLSKYIVKISLELITLDSFSSAECSLNWIRIFIEKK